MRRLRLNSEQSDDPLDGMANLFDLGVVFALGFGIAILSRVASTSPEQLAQLQRSTQRDQVPNAERVPERFRSTDENLGGNGTRLGTAYRLANGEVVYVPETAPSVAVPESP